MLPDLLCIETASPALKPVLVSIVKLLSLVINFPLSVLAIVYAAVLFSKSKLADSPLSPFAPGEPVGPVPVQAVRSPQDHQARPDRVPTATGPALHAALEDADDRFQRTQARSYSAASRSNGDEPD